MRFYEKKLIAAVMALILVLSLFTACGKGGNTSTVSSGAVASVDVNKTDEDGRITFTVYESWCWDYNDLYDFFESDERAGSAAFDTDAGEYVALFVSEESGETEIVDFKTAIGENMILKKFDKDGKLLATFVIDFVSEKQDESSLAESSDATSSVTASEETEQKEVITLLCDTANKILMAEIDKFNKENENYVIETMSNTVSGKAYTYSQLKKLLSGDERPDIVYLDSPLLMTAAKAGYLVDLTRFDVEDARDKFIGSAMECLTASGKVYGLPLDAKTSILACNEDILNFVKLEALPENYEQLLASAKKTSETYSNSSASLGIALSGSDSVIADTFISWLYRLGGEALYSDYTAAFHEEEGIAVLEMFCELIEEGVSKKEWNSQDFYSGKTAFAEISSDNYKTVFGSGATANYKGIAFPSLVEENLVDTEESIAKGLMSFNAFGIVTPVNPDEDKLEAVYDFIKGVCTDIQFQTDFCTSAYRLPTLLSAQYKKNFTTDEMALYVGQLRSAKTIPSVAGWSAIESYIADAVKSVINGEMEAREALSIAAAKTNARLARN